MYSPLLGIRESRVRGADLGSVLGTSFCSRILSISTETSLVLEFPHSMNELETITSDPRALAEAYGSGIGDIG